MNKPRTWAERARLVIAGVLEVAERDGVTELGELKKRLSQAYPFGERKHHPYQAWLAEVQLTLEMWSGSTPVPRVESEHEVSPGLREPDAAVAAWLERQRAVERVRRLKRR